MQPKKMPKGLKFRSQEVDELYYLCCENKGPDQLHSYRTADLRLCFCICKSRFSNDAAQIRLEIYLLSVCTLKAMWLDRPSIVGMELMTLQPEEI